MELKAYDGIGQWIREKLIEAGSRGVVCADLYSELNELRKIGKAPPTFRRMKLHSFYRYFAFLYQLKWIEETTETEPGYQKYGTARLRVDRRYYRITKKGLDTSVTDWANPLASQYPDWSGEGERKREYMKKWRESERGREYMREYMRKRRKKKEKG